LKEEKRVTIAWIERTFYPLIQHLQGVEEVHKNRPSGKSSKDNSEKTSRQMTQRALLCGALFSELRGRFDWFHRRKSMVFQPLCWSLNWLTPTVHPLSQYDSLDSFPCYVDSCLDWCHPHTFSFISFFGLPTGLTTGLTRLD
jgi:hypothetical protein